VDDDLIAEYIRELVTFKKENFVALYAAQLPADQQVLTYLEFIQQVSVPEQRFKEEHWKLALSCGLKCEKIAEQLVAFIERESRVDMQRAIEAQCYSLFLSPSTVLDELDHQGLNLLEWLVAKENSVPFIERAALLLSGYFLATVKIQGAKAVRKLVQDLGLASPGLTFFIFSCLLFIFLFLFLLFFLKSSSFCFLLQSWSSIFLCLKPLRSLVSGQSNKLHWRRYGCTLSFHFLLWSSSFYVPRSSQSTRSASGRKRISRWKRSSAKKPSNSLWNQARPLTST
jgi:hypothetical protein